MSKTQAISILIHSHVAKGMSVRDAIDAVFGAGTFEKLAHEIYDALNERTA